MWTLPNLQRRARRNAWNAALEARARRIEREDAQRYLDRINRREVPHQHTPPREH